MIRLNTENLFKSLIAKVNFAEMETYVAHVALDAGHGTDTLGKGVVGLKEHDFNATVIKYAIPLFAHNKIKVTLTQPLFGKDVPLANRSKIANDAKVDFLMSVHADANADKTAHGHWGFYWKTSAEGKKLADIWYEELNAIKPKEQLDPKRKNSASYYEQWNNFHMVRETKMEAVLMEHAFMTNAGDLKLLQSDDFRKKCAVAMVKTACKYKGIKFSEIPIVKPSVVKPVVPKPSSQVIGEATLKVSALNVRKQPYTQAEIVDVLKAGEVYKVYGQTDNWVKVENGYASNSGDKYMTIKLYPKTTPVEKAPEGKLFKVQVGAFKVKDNADKLSADLARKGHKNFVKQVKGLHKVQVGAFSLRKGAETVEAQIEKLGYDPIIVLE